MPSSSSPLNGETIAGRYRVGLKIGAGGMGAVYRGFDERLNREVAIKLLAASALGKADARARLIEEALACAALRHAGIVHVYDVGETADGGAYLVMELVHGRSLRALLDEDSWEPRARVRAIVEAARALGEAHRKGLVHRDVKPDNLMLRDDGHTVLLDFGIAKAPAGRAIGLTGEGVVLGTPSYLSPEQARGEPLDGRTDQFSLAVTAYELLARRLPWKSGSAVELIGSILTDAPRALGALDVSISGVEAVIGRALSKGPRDRFADVDAFGDALAASAGIVEAPSSRSPGGVSGAPAAFTPDALARTELAITDDPARNRARGRRRWAALAIVATLVCGAGAWHWHAHRNPLRVADPVLACPVLEGNERGVPAPWLGAAAAFRLCDYAAVALGGFRRHVRSPAQLLALPRLATETPASDPYESPQARQRSLVAARDLPAYLDGSVEVRADRFDVSVVLRTADGRELGRAQAEAQNLDAASHAVIVALARQGALGASREMDADFRAFTGLSSTEQALSVAPLLIPETRGVGDPVCVTGPTADLPDAWREELETNCGRRPESATAGARLPPILRVWRVTASEPAELAWLRAELQAPIAPDAKAMFMIAAAARAGGGPASHESLLAAMEIEPRVALMFSLDEAEDARAVAFREEWAPDSSRAWGSGLFEASADVRKAVGRYRRAVVLDAMRSNRAERYGEMLLEVGDASSARAVAFRLSGSTDANARDVASSLAVRADACDGRLAAALAVLTGELSGHPHLFARADNFRITAAREVALALGSERAFADAVARPFAEGRTDFVAEPSNGTAIGNVAAVCAYASPEIAKPCLAKLRAIAQNCCGQTDAEKRMADEVTLAILDIADAFATGNFAQAAAKARALVTRKWAFFRTGDLIVDALDRGGAYELAEDVDRYRLQGGALHGVNLAHLRAARRANVRADMTRAKELARRVLDAWRAIDVEPPAIAEMRAIVASP